MKYSLSLTSNQHAELKEYLIHADGKERVAWLSCGTAKTKDSYRLLVRGIHPLPDESYVEHSKTKVTWKTDSIIHLFDLAEENNLSLVKVHSHPAYCRDFSLTDDHADSEIFKSIYEWIGTSVIKHASCLMLPDGEMI